MSRQLFEQIVAMERALDALAERVAALETSAELPRLDGAIEGPEITFRRGPGRPPKANYGD